MKLAHASTLIAALLITGLQLAPSMAADLIGAVHTEEGSATEVRNSNRERAEQAQAEAVEDAAEAVLSATKLDLDIRLIGPTSVAGDL